MKNGPITASVGIGEKTGEKLQQQKKKNNNKKTKHKKSGKVRLERFLFLCPKQISSSPCSSTTRHDEINNFI